MFGRDGHGSLLRRPLLLLLARRLLAVPAPALRRVGPVPLLLAVPSLRVGVVLLAVVLLRRVALRRGSDTRRRKQSGKEKKIVSKKEKNTGWLAIRP